MTLLVAVKVLSVAFWAFWLVTNIHSAIWVLAVGTFLATGFLVVLWRAAPRAQR